MLGALWEVEVFKKRMPLWREAHLEVKMAQKTMFGALLELEMFENSTPLWREAHFEVKTCKAPQVRSTFGS